MFGDCTQRLGPIIQPETDIPGLNTWNEYSRIMAPRCGANMQNVVPGSSITFLSSRSQIHARAALSQQSLPSLLRHRVRWHRYLLSIAAISCKLKVCLKAGWTAAETNRHSGDSKKT